MVRDVITLLTTNGHYYPRKIKINCANLNAALMPLDPLSEYVEGEKKRMKRK